MGENEAPAEKSGWQKFWTGVLPADIQIILGTFFVIVLFGVLVWIALNEGGDNGRLAEFDLSYQARSIEQGAVIFASTCSECHGSNGEGSGKGPALNTPSLFNGERLEQVGFGGGLEEFIRLTVAAGRPTSSNFPNPMPTWGEEFGGPLRPDQVADVVNYVLNFGQNPGFQPTPVADLTGGQTSEGGEVVPAQPNFIGLDIETELPEGDVARGQELFEGDLGCTGCHVAGAGPVAPDIQGIGTRAAQRVEGQSAAQYIRESIQLPAAYVVDGYNPIMTTLNLGDRLTPQDLADMIAYLLTLE